MQLKLRQIKTEIDTAESLQLFKHVFFGETEQSILNFHLANYGIALNDFTYKLRPDYTCEDIFFIFSDDTVIGYVTAYDSRWPELPYAKEFGIFIKGSYRNLGYGSQIIALMESNYQSTYVVSPHVDNFHAIRLYERLGYIKSPHAKQEDLLLMFK